ncbi:MAG TPA: STAS domain-containing protein [Candidatus Avamphibacillus sp.]|nr:STAS domain-containing protein [Candidatus Avamphibacillus sp.]
MNLNIEVEDNDNKKTMYLSGEIDIYTAPKLKKELLNLTKNNGVTVNVDMNNVNYMDSTGLGVFISAVKSTKENNSHLKLVNLHERVLRLFEITGLIEIMDIQPAIRGVSE